MKYLQVASKVYRISHVFHMTQHVEFWPFRTKNVAVQLKL